MVTFVERVKRFFYPVTPVPETDAQYEEAVAFRLEKVVELRASLKTDPFLNAKIDGITAKLLSGAEPK